jgi:hypothetical protein
MMGDIIADSRATSPGIRSVPLAEAKVFLAAKYREILSDHQKLVELYANMPDIGIKPRTRILKAEVIDALAAQVYRELPPSVSNENLTKIFTQVNDARMSGWRYFSE